MRRRQHRKVAVMSLGETGFRLPEGSSSSGAQQQGDADVLGGLGGPAPQQAPVLAVFFARSRDGSLLQGEEVDAEASSSL